MRYFTFSIVLFLVVGISCGILAYVNELTQPLIIENLRQEEEIARKKVFPDAARFELVESESEKFYQVFNGDNDLIGYTIVAKGRGYCSVIQTMVGVNLDFTIQNIFVIYQNETPGLGDKYVNQNFYDLFSGLGKQDMKVDKDGGSIASITGATVTARAIVRAVGEYIERLQSVIGDDNEVDSQ